MQFESKDIYRAVANKTGEDLEYIEAVGNYIQKRLVEELKNPKKLILSVKGIGRWFLRKKRLQAGYERLLDIDMSKYEEDTPHNKNKKEVIQKIIGIMKDRLDEYKLFLEKKSLVRQKKNEYEESCKNNTTEYNSSDTGIQQEDNPSNGI